MIPLPNLLAPIVDKVTGHIKRPWNSFLQQFVQAPPNFAALNVTASPFTYTAAEPGALAISGGTITDVRLKRGIVTIDLGATPKLIPLAIGDTVGITYSVLPTLYFIASYGQNTTS